MAFVQLWIEKVTPLRRSEWCTSCVGVQKKIEQGLGLISWGSQRRGVVVPYKGTWAEYVLWWYYKELLVLEKDPELFAVNMLILTKMFVSLYKYLWF